MDDNNDYCWKLVFKIICIMYEYMKSEMYLLGSAFPVLKDSPALGSTNGGVLSDTALVHPGGPALYTPLHGLPLAGFTTDLAVAGTVGGVGKKVRPC